MQLVKMRSCCSRMGPWSNVTAVLIKRPYWDTDINTGTTLCGEESKVRGKDSQRMPKLASKPLEARG